MAKQEKSEYAKKLLDPRWQRKRLEILQRDGFACRRCYDTESTLHVHHCVYVWGNDPWDYPDASLVTLCETCHAYESANGSVAKKTLADAFARVGFLSDDMLRVAEAVAVRPLEHMSEVQATWVAFVFKDDAAWEQLVQAFHDDMHRRAFGSEDGATE